MKKDYLWDKTGEDSEIEELENALRAFRYQETSPPAIGPKILPFKNEPARRFSRLAMAAAACLMFGIFALAVWVQFLNDKTETKSDVASAVIPRNETAFVAEMPVEEPDFSASKAGDNSPLKNIKKPKRSFEQKSVKTRYTVSANVRRKKTTQRNIRRAEPEVLLTKEEQYAYNQLMLALSIASSGLKTVKDKAQGLE